MRFGLLVGVLVFSACNDEDQHESIDDGGAAGYPGTQASSSDGGEDDEDAARFLREYAAAVCVMYRPCCMSEGLGYDGAGCTEWFHETFERQVFGEFHEDAGEHCLAALADANASDPNRCLSVTSFNEATLRAECKAAFVPLPRSGAGLGEDCHFADDCASSSHGEVTCFQNQCLLQRRGAAGEGPCLFSASLVEEGATEIVMCEARDGVYCHLEADACTRFSRVGEACPHFGACEVGSMCLSGYCHDLPERGEECLNTTPGLCAPGSACNEEQSICGPPLSAGEECSDSFACASGSCLSGHCADPEFMARLSCTGEE